VGKKKEKEIGFSQNVLRSWAKARIVFEYNLYPRLTRLTKVSRGEKVVAI